MKKLTFLQPLAMILTLSWVFTSCSNYNTVDYQGVTAKITDIRTAKHGLKVVDVLVENKSNQRVEVKTSAMGSNGIMYIAFDKKSYDNSGENTTARLSEIFINPNDQLSLTWVPFTRKKDESNSVSSLIFSIELGGAEKSLILN